MSPEAKASLRPWGGSPLHQAEPRIGKLHPHPNPFSSEAMGLCVALEGGAGIGTMAPATDIVWLGVDAMVARRPSRHP